jgi:molybdopterin-containing oxidoreductase family iron-sulfur binding subunit
MPNLNRRDFLKALGLTSGASALSACGLDTNQYSSPVEQLLPYVVKPDQVVPGTYTFFATSALRGPAAVPVTARHRDGRVTFVSANFGVAGRKPPTSPQVPSSALFELQRHYGPDRIKSPTEAGQPIGWSDAIAKVGAAVKAARDAGKKVAFLGSYLGPSLAKVVDGITGGQTFAFEADGYAAVAQAATAVFGAPRLPYYGLDKAKFVLSFGAPFLSGWGGADIEGRFATGRDPNVGNFVTRFALVAPHRDQTGAKADDFLAAKPGSEVLVARAIAASIASSKGNAAVAALAGNVTIEQAAAASGLDAAKITAVIKNFEAGDAVALPGGVTGSADLAAASFLINLAAGTPAELFSLGGFGGRVSTLADLDTLAADLAAGSVDVLFLEDIDPVYALPNHPIAAAIEKAGLLVALSSNPSESVAKAKLVLPTNSAFEDWGDEEPFAGLRVLRQPAMTPLHDTASVGEFLLAVGKAAGATEAPFAAASWREFVVAESKALAPAGTVDLDGWWAERLQDGFISAALPAVQPTATAPNYGFAEVKPVEGTVLVVHTHPFLRDGRYANQPWAQEVPHPMTGGVWSSWVEISPATAAKLGVQTGDAVAITTPGGEVEISAYVYPGVADDVLGLALGQGHTAASGRYSTYGVSGAKLSGAAAGGAPYTPVAASAKATGRTGDFVTAFSLKGMDDNHRNFGVYVAAAKLAEFGDKEAEHPGELTGIHHLELDKRLQERKITDFYTLPDHPTYRFGLTVDTNACTGCGACSVACYAENNLPIVGKRKVAEGREMGWIRINRYWEQDIGGVDDIHFVPMMCQQCGHAGCENVCPVLATYHNLDGLNAMVYNRCVGTRYCSNACPFSARRFNWHTYQWPEPFNLQLNPDVMVRQMGVMEKCTFCVQRLRSTKAAVRNDGNFTATVPHERWEQVPACAEACPSQALTFGNLNDEKSKVSLHRKSGRAYQPLADLNVFSAVNYMAKANFHDDPTAGHHGGGHGAEAAHGATHEGEAHGAAAGGTPDAHAPAGHGEGQAAPKAEASH